jgi:hypothetical protein
MSASASGAAAAIAQAIKASGVIVKVEPDDFLQILGRQEAPLVISAGGGLFLALFRSDYQYLTSYKGLAFFTKSPEPLNLPDDSEVVLAKKICIPG